MPTEYKLTTLRDVYERVPQNKIAICMREIALGMELARGMQKILNAAADEVDPGTTAGLEWPAEVTWVDDNDSTVTLMGVTDDSEDPLFTLAGRLA